MDPEPNLKNSNNSNAFIECEQIKPYISYGLNNGVKTFNTISLIDDSESIIFSEANFDSDYNLLYGEIKALSFRSDEYSAVKRSIRDISLEDLAYLNLEPTEVSILKTGLNGQTFEISDNNQMRQIPYIKAMLKDIVLDDKKIISQTDKINNYLMEYTSSKKLSTRVFKEIEQSEFKKQFTAVQGSKQKVMSA